MENYIRGSPKELAKPPMLKARKPGGPKTRFLISIPFLLISDIPKHEVEGIIKDECRH